MSTEDASPLLVTPLYDLHHQLGAVFAPFAGYRMPLHYPSGILREHRHTRSAASLFDVSHMGHVVLSSDCVPVTEIGRVLESVCPVDMGSVLPNQQRYALLTNDQGGIVDDVMVSYGDRQGIQLIVNAVCRQQDSDYLRQCLPSTITVTFADKALLALQGPQARAVMKRLVPALSQLSFMHTTMVMIEDMACWVACSGYTGEDGFELSVDAKYATQLAQCLLAQPEVAMAGLGARDTLRLEAGLCLYGADTDATITPVEANLAWAIPASRKPGGVRAGGYSGAAVIERQLKEGVKRKRYLLKPHGRMLVRAGSELVDDAGKRIGEVTSGGFGATVNGPVAMGYINTTIHTGDEVFARVRGKPIAVTRVDKTFVPHRYCRE